MWATEHHLLLILHQPPTISPYLPVRYQLSPTETKAVAFQRLPVLQYSCRIPPPSFFFFFLPFEMIPISTNLCHCIYKYPASSKNVFAEKKNQRPFKKGNHNIISIFSFRCLNWHEEYNQIRLLTVTHMLLQEREKYHLPAYISGQDFFFLPFSFFLFLFSFSFFSKSVFIMVLLLKL